MRQQHAQGDEIHIGDAVLKAGGDKGAYRQHDAQQLVGQSAPGHRQPDRQADQHIRQNAAHKDNLKGQVDLGLSRGDGGVGKGIIPLRPPAAEIDQQHYHQGPGQIAHIDQRPVAAQLAQADVAADQAHQHQAVAGEQFGPGDDHHKEGHGQADAHQQFSGAGAQLGADGNGAGQDAAQADEKAGQHGQGQGGNHSGLDFGCP